MKFNQRNVFISPRARLGKDVRIGDNSSIYDNVTVDDNSVICNDCVLGEPTSDYYNNPDYENPATYIGAGSLIRSHTIVYGGVTIGRGFSSGHRATIREETIIGDYCSVGTLCDIQGHVRMGDYCRLHSNVHLSQTSSIGNYVFLFPFVVITNDPTPPSKEIKGGQVGDFSVVGAHAVILPGVQIGKNCLVAANSVVTRSFGDFSLVKGDPARFLIDIRKFMVMGKGKPYPWMQRFDRGMPWEGVGFDAWSGTICADEAPAGNSLASAMAKECSVDLVQSENPALE